MSTKVRIGLVGCGRIAQRHAEHINNKGRLVATCDIKSEKAQSLAIQYAAKPYGSIDEMLVDQQGNMDLVSVCSPNGLHSIHTIKSLEAGYHVLCEKPMAISVHDCGDMIQSAEKANRRLFVVKQNRFNPPIVAAKKIIEEKRLGKLFSVQLNCFWNRDENYYANSWKGTKSLDGGTLYTQFSHFIDLLYWLFGDVKQIKAFGKNFNHEGIVEFEDTGSVILEFYNGMIGTINYTVNCFQKNMEGSISIFGRNGTLKIGGQYLNELEYQAIKNYEIKNLPTGNPPNNYGLYQGSMSNHDKVYENVIDVLTNNGIIATNGFEGLKTVEIIDRIYQAMNS